MEISDISDVIEDNNEDDHEESGDQAQKSTDPHEEQKKQKKNQLNNYVAITVVLFVTFMGVCKVKSDNVVQAMQKAQADRIDTWAFYQARNMRAEVAKSTIAQLKLQVQTLQAQPQPQPKLLAAYGQEITKYEAIATKQDKEKDTLQQQAIDAEKLYEQLNVHDDQFDLSEAAFALAIALLAMTSLTQKGWLYGAAMVPAAFGLFMGIAGLLNWDYHPEALTKMLSENTIHQKHPQISTSAPDQPKI